MHKAPPHSFFFFSFPFSSLPPLHPRRALSFAHPNPDCSIAEKKPKSKFPDRSLGEKKERRDHAHLLSFSCSRITPPLHKATGKTSIQSPTTTTTDHRSSRTVMEREKRKKKEYRTSFAMAHYGKGLGKKEAGEKKYQGLRLLCRFRDHITKFQYHSLATATSSPAPHKSTPHIRLMFFTERSPVAQPIAWCGPTGETETEAGCLGLFLAMHRLVGGGCCVLRRVKGSYS
ncbi:unnamed protein product [Tuber aestivum]|uniref:Uncharacterized protein n=1 Tax=Tuber aestivum TaxID=59557 RepID=A0A292PM08_9PEZI|nr:unnamed protein product [Tuber aestivum]